MRRHNALFSKYGVSVRTHVHEGICIHWWLGMSYLNILLQVEVVVHNCILHDLLYACCYTNSAIFSVEECAQGLLLCVCLFVLCE